APDQIVVAASKHWCNRDCAFEAGASFIKTTKIREQCAQQFIGHCIRGIRDERLSQYLFRLLIAVLDQKSPRSAKTPEAAPAAGRRCAPETSDCGIAMPQRECQSAGAKPCLSQQREQLGCAVVCSDRRGDIALLLKSDSKTEKSITVSRIVCYRFLQCGNGIGDASDFEAG